jgi:hypothetical protein
LTSIENGFIFIEESGCGIHPSSKDNFFIVSFLYCIDPSSLRISLRRHLIRQQIKGRYPFELKELKFNPPWNSLKKYGYFDWHIDMLRVGCH